MSDYEVTLVNDNMQEFYVRFYGPSDSKDTRNDTDWAHPVEIVGTCGFLWKATEGRK